jgi:hypothetical protein
MFTFIDDLPPNILGVEAAGKITHEDYQDRLIPKAEAMMAKGPIRVLSIVHSNLSDMTLEALWDDQKFGFKHWSDVSHMALVTDHAWMRTVTAMFAPLTPIRIREFPISKLAEARDWIVSVA